MNARTCIICGGGTGSREHIFPAALGGRRTNKGIYCGVHNEGYSGLAGIIASQLSIFNALLGVVGDHASEPTSVTMMDVESGHEIQVSTKRTRFKSGQVLSEKTEVDRTIKTMSFNSRFEADDWAREQQANGSAVQITGKGERTRYHPGTIRKQAVFGGNEEGLRAVGYIAQTFLAHLMPDIARMPEMQGIKDYTLKNLGTDFVWWDFDATPQLPPNKFPFGHRVIVGLNSKDNSVYARISFFSTLNFSILLGNVPIIANRVFITDIDPLAKSPPDDIITSTEHEPIGAVVRPESLSAELANAVYTGRMKSLIEDLMRRITDFERGAAAEKILRRIAGAKASGSNELAALFADIIAAESQRVRNLISYLATDLKSRASNAAQRDFASFLDEASASDPSAANGLTDEATRSLSLASDALAKQMLDDWQDGTLDLDRIEMLIGGGPGADVVGTALLERFSLRFPE